VDYNAILQKHNELGKRTWTHDEIVKTIKDNTLFSWGATEPSANSALVVAKGEGCYFYDVGGRKYLDFNSQAMCSTLGHTVPPQVIDAINAQLKDIAYAYPCATVTPIKAKLSALLADLLPGDLNHFFYTTGGAESNETAMRMARLYTGRYKILRATAPTTGAPSRPWVSPVTLVAGMLSPPPLG